MMSENEAATCATCATCPFLGAPSRRYDSTGGKFYESGALCRHDPPPWHEVDPAVDCCGEHPRRQPHFLAEVSSVAPSLTEVDVRSIIAAVKSEADKARMAKARAARGAS